MRVGVNTLFSCLFGLDEAYSLEELEEYLRRRAASGR